jgi:hypothetical protein
LFKSQINPNSYALIDLASNINNNLDGLESIQNLISSVKLSGTSSTISVTPTQLVNDAPLLSKLTAPFQLTVSGVIANNVSSILNNANVTNVAVVDTSANVLKNLDALQSHLFSISSITLTNNVPLTVSAAQAQSDAGVLALIQNNGGVYNIGNSVVLPAGNSTTLAFPNTTITGQSGVNTVVFNEPSTVFKVTQSGVSIAVVDTTGAYGTVALNNVQRLKFSDMTELAMDFQPGHSAFNSAFMVGTAFGAGAVPSLLSAGLSLYDAGQTDLQVAATIEGMGYIENQIKSTDNLSWVQYVYKNIFGVSPSAATVATYVNELDTGLMTKATMLAAASETAAMGWGTLAKQINLVGLQQSGLLYLIPTQS